MGSVFQQKSGKWGIRFDTPDNQRKRKQKQIGGFSKKAEAEKELKKIEVDILNGEFFHGASGTVSQYLSTWIYDFVKPNRAPKTFSFYQSLYKAHFKDYFDKILLSELRAIHVDAFYRHLAEHTRLSANSIHHCHKTLCAALNQAVKWDLLKESPMSKVTAPRQEKAKSSYWPPDVIPEAAKLFVGDEIEWMVRIALLLGLRQGEICALNINNIDFENKTLRITETAQRISKAGIILKPPKTKESADALPITDEVAEILKKQILHITDNKKMMLAAGKPYNNEFSGYLALWADGRLMDPNYVGGRFRKILRGQDRIERITFHDLRHSCASWLIYNGVDMKTIQLILRHSNFKVTANTYSHISQDSKMEALNRLTLCQKVR